MTSTIFVPPLVIDGALTDGHRDEVHDLLQSLVKVEWHTKRIDAKRDWHYTALARTTLTLDCTAAAEDWTPEPITVGAAVSGHPGGRDAMCGEEVLCWPLGIERRGELRLVRYELSIED